MANEAGDAGFGHWDCLKLRQANKSLDDIYCNTLGNTDVKSLRLINDQERFIIVTLLSCFLGIPTCLVGIVANIINLSVFIRQGFEDSINISLACLSFADLGSLLTLLWRNLLYVPYIGNADWPLDAVSFIYLTGGTPHVTFVRISGCITAFVAVKRCISIAFPLKVKTIMTHSRTCVINAAIYVFTIASIIPLLYSNRIAWKFYPDRNRTLLGMTYTENYRTIESVSFVLNGLIIPFTAFFVEIVCTFIMVLKLHRQAKWRKETMSANLASDALNKKDFRIMKMVMTLTVIFIVCSLPINFNYLWVLVDKDVTVQGKYANSVLISASFAFLCEAINSTLNHFVYMQMSSKFKRTYMEMCFMCGKCF